jgi:hypothetical protein
MADRSWQDELTIGVRTLQIIVAAIAMGCAMFMVIAVAIGWNRAASEPSVLTYLAAAFAATAIIVRSIVPGLAVSQGRKKILRETPAREPADDWPIKLMRLMTAKTIVAAAVLEGATFFLLVAYLVEKSPWTLGIAIALLIGILLNWPTQSSAQAWIGGQLQRLEEEQQSGG